jgi:hypothetical protein
MRSLLLAAACAVGFAGAASASTLSPLALYTFDDGTAADVTGNGNDGTILGGFGLGTSFNGSNAGAFSALGGTSGIDTSININKSAMASMSMGAWVFATANGLGPGGKILSHDNGNFGRTLGLDNRGDSPGTDFAAFGGPGVAVVDANDPASPLGQWVHLAVVYDGANSGLYINGVLDSSFVDNTTTAPGLTAGLFIGTNNYFNEDFVGLMDDVFVFDRALSASEVSQIANTGFAAPVPLPAGLPLLAVGLGAFAALRRKA